MIFGPKFYPLLEKMTGWRKSLFALVLATRQYPNFALWAELEQKQGSAEFKKALQECWQFHFDKFNHIDLGATFESVSPFIPDEESEDFNEGTRFAFDAMISLNAAIDAILIDTDEASTASKASMASVIRLCENRYDDEELNEELLHEKEEIENEVNFQVTLMEMVQKARSPELVLSLLNYALDPAVSNIGLENPLTLEDLRYTKA